MSPWFHRFFNGSRRSLGLQLSAAVRVLCLSVLLARLAPVAQAESGVALVDYASVHQLFVKHCLDCHAAQEPEANLVLDSFESLMHGGESGPVIVPSQSNESLLVKMVEGRLERAGKTRIMPPGKRPKLSASEISTLRGWIDAGAKPSADPTALATTLIVPKILPHGAPRRPVHALSYAPGPNLIALGRDGEVELLSAQTQSLVRSLSHQPGAVNALAFSGDGKFLFAAGGQAGLSGEVKQWNVSDGSLVRTFAGHKDAIYSLALSPDGLTLATGSYDQKIKLWQVPSGTEVRTLSGHSGAVFSLAFRPDGRLLASASADRTVKLWDVRSGERRDTFSQSLKEVNAVVFAPDGQRLLAGGADNRIRIWAISENGLETTNPILESRFAHDGAILSLAFSPDGKSLLSSASDQTVKVWDVATLTEHRAFDRQPDWAPAVAFLQNSDAVIVGRLDGSFAFYDVATGSVKPPPKPELTRLEPRGIQRGTVAKVKLIGSGLARLSSVFCANGELKVSLAPPLETQGDERWLQVESSSSLPPGPYEIVVRSDHGESGKLKLYVDDLPQLSLLHSGTNTHRLEQVPISVWGVHEKSGDAETLSFEAEAGQQLVFDIAAQRFGSKADILLTLTDAQGKVLASSSRFDGSHDPLLVHTFGRAGQYSLRVSELVLAGSAEHFYRLSVGAFPYVTGCFPISVPAGLDTELELIGYNLPVGQRLKVSPDSGDEFKVPLPPAPWRSRGELKVQVSHLIELLESEPNNQADQATSITVPGAINGRLWSQTNSGDVDLFRFHAETAQPLIIETVAAQRGSPADTRLDILHPDGRPVERLLLQATRDSAVTFRGIDSDTTDCRLVNWEEMNLNQFLYFQGEVVRLFRAPQGPDSGFLFYSAHGKRRSYFDSSPAAHALDEPCYIVEAHQPGAKLISNGLPVFPIYYSNDDDSDRALGADSRIHFTAPADGDYLVRVTDARGFSGERFVYRLVIRPAEPDFNLVLKTDNGTVNAGSGQGFSVAADRMDGFEGEIQVSLNHLPVGFIASTPLTIEAGHTEARGTLCASRDAPAPTEQDWAKVEATASALVNGQTVVKAVHSFGPVKLGEKPKILVALEPDPVPQNASNNVPVARHAWPTTADDHFAEITLVPGTTVPALLRVERHGRDDLITLSVENLPHGVIVDNIGLNGVLIPKGQNERQIFISAAHWVPDTDRLCYAVENQAGRQTSRPVRLHVRRTTTVQTAAPH